MAETKAQKVRDIIVNAEAEGLDLEAQIQAVIKETNFKRQLARRYVLENKAKMAKKAAPRMTLEEALAKVPVKGENGRFLKKEVREAMAKALIEAAA